MTYGRLMKVESIANVKFRSFWGVKGVLKFHISIVLTCEELEHFSQM